MSGLWVAGEDAKRESDREYFIGIAQRAYGIEEDDEIRQVELVAGSTREERSYLELL